ncbi:MAG TPA: heavy-metal-associated domain-containing protein [Methylophilaceae bacterium]|jgi:copper chaperone
MHEFHIPRMSCGGCADTISKAVKQVDETAKLEFDLSARTVSIDSRLDREVLADAMTDAGYPPA